VQKASVRRRVTSHKTRTPSVRQELLYSDKTSVLIIEFITGVAILLHGQLRHFPVVQATPGLVEITQRL